MKWKGIIPVIRWVLIGEYNHPNEWIDAYITQRGKERAELFKLAQENYNEQKGGH